MKPLDEQKTEPTTVRLDPETDALAALLARRIGIPKAVFFRLCIENELKHKESITDVRQIGSR